MAIRHLTAAAVAATLSLSLVACGSDAEPQATSTTPTPTFELRDYQAEAQAIWDRAGSAARDQACGITDVGPEMGRNVDDEVYARLEVHVLPVECAKRIAEATPKAEEIFADLDPYDQGYWCDDKNDDGQPRYGAYSSYTRDEVDAVFDYLTPDICAPGLKVYEGQQDQWEQERQASKIAGLPGDSLTDDQKIAAYDAVCEYLNTAGSDLLPPTSVTYPPLGPSATGQQKWDVAVLAGYLVASGDCS